MATVLAHSPSRRRSSRFAELAIGLGHLLVRGHRYDPRRTGLRRVSGARPLPPVRLYRGGGSAYQLPRADCYLMLTPGRPKSLLRSRCLRPAASQLPDRRVPSSYETASQRCIAGLGTLLICSRFPRPRPIIRNKPARGTLWGVVEASHASGSRTVSNLKRLTLKRAVAGARP